jgi:hypothetical protein
MAERMSEQRQEGYLRPSNLGQPCERKLWYSVNTPEAEELLSSKVKFKFLYGDLIEALVLFLAREAGHDVKGCQDQVEVHGVKGKRDAIIDGTLVDVKSANTRAFDKFERHTLRENDPFGYIDQLGFYHEASLKEVEDKERAAFLVVDKELGGLVLDYHERQERDWESLIAAKREMLARPEPPERGFEDVPEGKSGNRRLTVPCTYCGFKTKCWPGLRTFVYANGPMFLTKVEKPPKPMEITDAKRVAA